MAWNSTPKHRKLPFAQPPVDEDDALLAAHLDVPGPVLHSALNEPQLDELAAGALHVAALREAFEETRQIELAPPQIMSLAHLSRYSSVEDALAQARGHAPPVILPEPFEHEGARVICYPGDERHSVRQRALPGPTRLHYRNRRFEPAEGFEALFAQMP